MADRFPLILNTNINQIQEIASGDSLDLTGSNIANAGIITAGNVTIGAATTDLVVTGNARITGILTVGTGSLTLNGPNNSVNVGTALTLGHTQGLQFHTQNLHSAGFEVNQINVSGASTIGGNLDANGDLDVDGHTNLDNVNVVGVLTVTGAVNASHSNFGNLNTTGITIENTNASILFTDTNNNPDYWAKADSGIFEIVQYNNGGSNIQAVKINTDGHIDIATNVDFAAGIDVTGNATVSGNLSVGGVLTYEDVTNVDSIGIITARNGITVSSGTATFQGAIDANGDLDVDGHTNLDNVSISGLTTASQGIRVPNGSATSNYISVGNNGALRIWGTTHQFADIRSGNLHFRNNSLQNILEIQQDKDIFLYGPSYFSDTARFDSTVTISDTITHHGDTDTKIRFPSADTVTFETAGSERLRIDSDGHIRFGASGDGSDAAWGHSTYGNTEVAIDGGGGYAVLHFRGDGAGSTATRFSIGCGDDVFYMAYDDVDNRHNIAVTGAGNVGINKSNPGTTLDVNGTATATLFSGSGASLTALNMVTDSSPQLGGDLDVNSNKIKGGHTIYEIVANTRHKFDCNSNTIMNINGNGVDFQYGNNTHADNVENRHGTHNDIRIYHSGSHSYIKNTTDYTLWIQNNDSQSVIVSNNSGVNKSASFNIGAAAELYHANTKRFETESGGAKVSGQLTVDGQIIAYSANNNTLGLTGHRWANIFSQQGNFNNTVTIGASSSSDALIIQNSSNLKFCDGNGATTGTVSFDARTYDTNKARLHKWTSPALGGGSYGQYSEAWYDGGAYRHITSKSAGFEFDHHIFPSADNSKDLGTSSNRWRNVYTNDLNLSNEGSTNNVDGTWGNYTIQEGESDLYLINNRNGKKYKFNLTEVS